MPIANQSIQSAFRGIDSKRKRSNEPEQTQQPAESAVQNTENRESERKEVVERTNPVQVQEGHEHTECANEEPVVKALKLGGGDVQSTTTTSHDNEPVAMEASEISG